MKAISKILILAAMISPIASGAGLTLTWNDNSDNETGFSVERKQGSDPETPFTVIHQTGEDAVTYVDSAVVPGSTYTYRVSAFNQYGSSGYSNEASGVVDPFTPPDPVDPPDVGQPPAAPSLTVTVTVDINGNVTTVTQ